MAQSAGATERTHATIPPARRPERPPRGRFVPESPFRPDDGPGVPPSPEARDAIDRATSETPFFAAYADEDDTLDEAAALHEDFVRTLFDEAFDADVAALVGELNGVRLRMQQGESFLDGDRTAVERRLETHLVPLRLEAEAVLERMAEELAGVELEGMPEGEIDALLDGFIPTPDFGSPAMDDFFEGFFGKIKRAVKKVARGVKRAAKKAARVAGKILPTAILLRKLKGLVRPLLRRVLRFAIGRLPARFRPLARTLSRRFLGGRRRREHEAFALEAPVVDLAEGEWLRGEAESAAPTTDWIQSEFDEIVARYALDGEAIEQEPPVRAYLDAGEDEDAATEEASLADLEQARERFVRELAALEDGADPTVPVERFATAILAAARIAIKVIGRKRVVGFLAKAVAKLIRRYVGKRAAGPLSIAMVDAGLRLASLEAKADEAAPRVAAGVLAATVEETFERLFVDLDEEAFEDEATLGEHLEAAFEAAAREHFPPALLREDLRDAEAPRGAWVLAGRAGARFKRHTRPFPVTLTAARARGIESFGGERLDAFLREQLGLPIDTRAVRARVHVFEAIRGTRLEHVAIGARRIVGAGPAAVGRIHPLTCAAAARLHPGAAALCRDAAPKHLRDRRRIAVGQRFYVLEIPGARTAAPASGARRATRARRTRRAAGAAWTIELDTARRRIVVTDVWSEDEAARFVARLRDGGRRARPLETLRRRLARGLGSVLADPGSRRLRIRPAAGQPRDIDARLRTSLRVGGGLLGDRLARALALAVSRSLRDRRRAFGTAFEKALRHADEGVTVVIRIDAPRLFALLARPAPEMLRDLRSLRPSGLVGDARLRLKPGRPA